MYAFVNHTIRPLDFPLYRDCDLSFRDYTDEEGMRTYVRTLVLLLSKAAAELHLPGREFITFEHSISYGKYAVWGTSGAPSSEEVDLLRAKVQEIVSADMEIHTLRMPLEEALDYFRAHGRTTTCTLLENRGKCYVDCTQVEDYIDFIFGCVLPRSGMIQGFDILPYEQGILLRYPDRRDPLSLYPAPAQPKTFEAFRRQIGLLNRLGMEDLGPLNERIREGKASELITVSEAMQEREVARIADEIARRHKQGVRIVLISGPSSSGKTTFSKRLRAQLITHLLRPFTLSLDDFFVDRDRTPRSPNGDYDYESLYALDLPFLHEVLLSAIQGIKVELPTYDFASGSRLFKDRHLHLASDHVLIIEGIHALNPELIKTLPEHSVFRVFVSALTTLSLDTHNSISTSDNRLLRRMVRDAKYRAIPPVETIRRWKSVREGEEKWIFPYQEMADDTFNSAMLYELSALRPQAEPILSRVMEIDPEYGEARRLLRLLRLFEPIDLKYMPPTSLLTEFLGGSSFTY